MLNTAFLNDASKVTLERLNVLLGSQPLSQELSTQHRGKRPYCIKRLRINRRVELSGNVQDLLPLVGDTHHLSIRIYSASKVRQTQL